MDYTWMCLNLEEQFHVEVFKLMGDFILVETFPNHVHFFVITRVLKTFDCHIHRIIIIAFVLEDEYRNHISWTTFPCFETKCPICSSTIYMHRHHQCMETLQTMRDNKSVVT